MMCEWLHLQPVYQLPDSTNTSGNVKYLYKCFFQLILGSMWSQVFTFSMLLFLFVSVIDGYDRRNL